jgi:hypothetical protein
MLLPETRMEGIAHVDPRLMYARRATTPDSAKNESLTHASRITQRRRHTALRSFPPTIVNWFVRQVCSSRSLHRFAC